MQLFYYKDPVGNFGDDLNPWIWYDICPELFDQDSANVLVGIGTLLNDRAPKLPTKYVMGSGLGYHGFPSIDKNWNFVCVRGPLTAERLGLKKDLAITDPAILLAHMVKGKVKQIENMISFMPHSASVNFANWREICTNTGLQYLDPAACVHETVLKIRQSKLIIAEAMHAAIVADALRIPWIPVACYDHILEFKWMDWCKSLGLEYQPQIIASIWDMESNFDLMTKIKTKTKRSLIQVGIWHKNWWPPVPKTNRLEVQDTVIKRLSDIAHSGKAFLSKDNAHNQCLDRLVSTVDRFKHDWLSKQP